ncbi:GNAT family acetyltransferase [Enterococcus phoeniculicola ATCC BAA-412]|uniref:GNAT family acetyltransferase n=2 Tax=Enterococcus phoeniculicola TaxID=154621 RepID=R3WPC4_9ENTE|nr:GNAT family acetyltransferase [Enterococcus phoeniculicola ATCC BAA-412]EOT71295.1 GNAT family acetyltransferase [Enterococcus phoeniculicola ATCC BAA-412]
MRIHSSFFSFERGLFMEYTVKTFDELTTVEFYQLIKTRIAVFVVEQNCAYQEVDALDPVAWHTYLRNGEEICAYTRVYKSNDGVHIGRVLVKEDYRNQQLGRKIVQLTLDWIQSVFPNTPIIIGAQAHLQNFYRTFGFQPTSEVYLEDDIPHIDMEIRP